MASTAGPPHHLSSTHLHDLSGLTALVTGGGSGIGLMIAEAFACNGAKVYIAGRRLDTLEKAAASVAGRLAHQQNGFDQGSKFGSLIPITMDVTSKPSIQDVVTKLQEKEGKLHILVNNSGQVGPFSAFLNMPEPPEDIGKATFENESFEEWSALFNVNLSSIFFTTFAFLSLLESGAKDLDERSASFKHSASVINITSVSGKQRQAQAHFAYNVSKAGANHLTRLLSTELALKKKPIRVNAIAPGPFATEMTDHQGATLTSPYIYQPIDDNAISGNASYSLVNVSPGQPMSDYLRPMSEFGQVPDVVPRLGKDMEPWVVDAICKGISPHPLQRGGREEEIAATALLLASPMAGGYMNGQILLLDGGFLLVNPGNT